MFIVFDIGGTNTRVAGSVDGKTLGEVVIYPTPQDYSDGIQALAETAKRLAANTPITAIAGGVPGPMDLSHTQILKAPNMKDWNNKPLQQDLQQLLNTTVRLENDTAMWALAEAHTGAGKGKNIVVYITVSTGVGGTRIVNGQIDKSAFGFEIGHHTINPSGPICGCGGVGHLEAYIGGNAMEKRYNKKPKDITDEAVWEDATAFLAIGLLNTCVFWSPHIIILGGSMMKSFSMERVLASTKSLNYIVDTLPEIQRSILGESGGLIGALHFLSQTPEQAVKK
ncbi:MAG: ROK family protein [bacterium]|nr:ROK family protein [bacterium]